MMDFYPSITKESLLNSINHGRNFIDITDEQLEIILNCRKSTIHYKNSTWIKSITENFDVPMGAYDPTQIADLVGIYIFDTLRRIIDPKKIGLHRYDGLIVIPESNGPKISSILPKNLRAFKLLGFKIGIMSNLKVINFLNIIFSLSENRFKPFHKDKQNPSY